MDAREYLEQVGKQNAKVNLMLKQLQSLREALLIGSAPLDAEHVSHTRNVDVMGDKIAAIVDMQHELDAAIDVLIDIKRDVIQKVNQMGNVQEQLFLTERYLQLQSPSGIAKEHNVSTRWVRDVIASGVQRLQIVLNSVA